MIIEGLDNNVTEGSLKAQLLKGEQEEIYWMKLPDKVCITIPIRQSELKRFSPVDTHGGPCSTIMNDNHRVINMADANRCRIKLYSSIGTLTCMVTAQDFHSPQT